jgi:signal transduction histidine kinase
MLTNLLENATAYTPAGGEIRVSLSRSSAWAELRVSDTGIGIPAEELPQVFDRFFRGREARAMRPQGSGLGLAIVRHVAEVHGGEVRAESQPGRGTTFTVRLPLLGR